MGSRREELHKHFEGKRLRWISWGYKTEFQNPDGTVTYSVDEEDMRLIMAGYACYECGLVFEIGGLPAVLPECPFCGTDQTQRHAVVTPDGW